MFSLFSKIRDFIARNLLINKIIIFYLRTILWLVIIMICWFINSLILGWGWADGMSSANDYAVKLDRLNTVDNIIRKSFLGYNFVCCFLILIKSLIHIKQIKKNIVCFVYSVLMLICYCIGKFNLNFIQDYLEYITIVLIVLLLIHMFRIKKNGWKLFST
ncbi:MAG: hypothetical protein CSA42_02440 [Gammaproteobacteria bacterium]|nr:MAG: hypothetical protein CSA42_02440 [Gammaproteobacteria bacterium]